MTIKTHPPERVRFTLVREQGQLAEVRTNSAVLNHFLDLTKLSRARNTWINYAHDLKIFFAVIHKTPEQIDRKDCLAFMKQQQQLGLSEATLNRRLAAVEPLCQTFFDSIVHQPVKPALVKPGGGEELVLQLAQFFGLTDVSAQALLSESFRNAFAVSVYLAAASLYGGAPRFVVLDDVTSSFDAGHQFHLMEVIRTKFSRPGLPDGPQVILLSHDTLLEKLFNRNNGQPGWKHQKLEGTARTAVLPQSNAVNRVKDATIRFLGAGQVEDAAPRVRQYLAYRETPRLCRGGSKGLTFTAVAHRRDFRS